MSVDVGLLLGQTQGQSSIDLLGQTQGQSSSDHPTLSNVADESDVALPTSNAVHSSSLKSATIYDFPQDETDTRDKIYETDLDVAVIQYQRRPSPDQATTNKEKKRSLSPLSVVETTSSMDVCAIAEPIDMCITKQASLPDQSDGGTPLQRASRGRRSLRKISTESKNKSTSSNRRWSWRKKRTDSSPNLFKPKSLGEEVGDSPCGKPVTDGWSVGEQSPL